MWTYTAHYTHTHLLSDSTSAELSRFSQCHLWLLIVDTYVISRVGTTQCVVRTSDRVGKNQILCAGHNRRRWKGKKIAVFGVDKETTADLIGQVIPLSHKSRGTAVLPVCQPLVTVGVQVSSSGNRLVVDVGWEGDHLGINGGEEQSWNCLLRTSER